MKFRIFGSIVLILLTEVLHCRKYLVEVANNNPDKITPNKAVTLADEQEEDNEGVDEIDVEDSNGIKYNETDGINTYSFISNVI